MANNLETKTVAELDGMLADFDRQKDELRAKARAVMDVRNKILTEEEFNRKLANVMKKAPAHLREQHASTIAALTLDSAQIAMEEAKDKQPSAQHRTAGVAIVGVKAVK